MIDDIIKGIDLGMEVQTKAPKTEEEQLTQLLEGIKQIMSTLGSTGLKPLDNMYRDNQLETDFIINEGVRISEKTSSLPAARRMVVTCLIKTAVEQFRNANSKNK